MQTELQQYSSGGSHNENQGALLTWTRPANKENKYNFCYGPKQTTTHKPVQMLHSDYHVRPQQILAGFQLSFVVACCVCVSTDVKACLGANPPDLRQLLPNTHHAQARTQDPADPGINSQKKKARVPAPIWRSSCLLLAIKTHSLRLQSNFTAIL